MTARVKAMVAVAAVAAAFPIVAIGHVLEMGDEAPRVELLDSEALRAQAVAVC